MSDMSLREAIASGDQRVALEAIRDQLAAKLDSGMCKYCGGPKGEASGIAALTLRLMKVMEALEAIPMEEEVSALDELTERRASRRASGAADSVEPPARKQRRQGGRRTGTVGGPQS